MEVIERMVLLKLEEYKEKANRDRFILPLDKERDFLKIQLIIVLTFFNFIYYNL